MRISGFGKPFALQNVRTLAIIRVHVPNNQTLGVLVLVAGFRVQGLG